MPPIEENVPRQPFPNRRSRAFFSIRRKRDAVWLLVTIVPFLVAVTLVVFKVKLRKPVPAAEAPADR